MKRETTYLVLGTAAIAGALLLWKASGKRPDAAAPEQPTNNNSMNTQLTRGYRNNNPLNIRKSSANNWLGKVVPGTDSAFEQFVSMAYGYRAALYLLRKYIKDGYTTVADIISRWAPNNENNTAGYIQRVCSTTGYTPGTKISANDQQALCNLAYAMAIVENGNTPLPDIQQIREGWNLL